MGNIIGFGRRAREAYPATGGAAAATTSALQNRNVALPGALAVPFTPANGVLAAILFTPRVSGVIQVAASVLAENGTDAETYLMGVEVLPGTGLSVTDGDMTIDGWVVGTTSAPVVGGTPGSPVMVLEDISAPLLSGASGGLSVFGISDNVSRLPLGVPVVIVVVLGEAGSGHALAQLAVTNLSVMELP